MSSRLVHLKMIPNAWFQAMPIRRGPRANRTAGVHPGGRVYGRGYRRTALAPVDSGGWLTNSSAAITAGLEDFNDGVSVSQANSVTGNISGVSGGRSVLSLSGFVNGAPNNIPGNYRFAAYPFTFGGGGGSGMQLLEIDGLGITSGAAYAQTSATLAASQGYGLNLSAPLNLSGYQQNCQCLRRRRLVPNSPPTVVYTVSLTYMLTIDSSTRP